MWPSFSKSMRLCKTLTWVIVCERVNLWAKQWGFWHTPMLLSLWIGFFVNMWELGPKSFLRTAHIGLLCWLRVDVPHGLHHAPTHQGCLRSSCWRISFWQRPRHYFLRYAIKSVRPARYLLEYFFINILIGCGLVGHGGSLNKRASKTTRHDLWLLLLLF